MTIGKNDKKLGRVAMVVVECPDTELYCFGSSPYLSKDVLLHMEKTSFELYKGLKISGIVWRRPNGKYHATEITLRNARVIR